MSEIIPKILLNLKEKNKDCKVKLRYRKPYENSNFLLYLDYYDKGKRRTLTTKQQIIGDKKNRIKDKESLIIALAMRNEIEREVLEGETGIRLTKQKEINFMEFFENFSKGKKDTNYRVSYNYFRDFFGKDNINIKHINIPLCEKYKEYLLSLEISEYTALHYFITFKATLNYAVRLNYINKNPAQNITIKYEKKSIERLTIDEVKKLMNTECKYQSLKNGFLFSCFTGLRYSDLVNLKFSDIENEHLRVIQKKTKMEIEVKLNNTAKKIIEEQKLIKKDDYVFHISSGGRRSKRIKKWLQDAGIKKAITFHCSRHTFGCILIEIGVDVFTVKKLMGHKNIKTTLQYVEKVDSTKDIAIDKLPIF